MKLARISNGIAACAILLSGSSADANPICSSDLLFVPYHSCANPAHGELFKQARTEVCGVELYRSCMVTRSVDSFTEDFTGHFGEMSPGPNAGAINCRMQAGNPARMERALESAAKRYYSQYESNANVAQETALSAIRALLADSPKSVTAEGESTGPLYEGGRTVANWWRIRCSSHVTYQARVQIRGSVCGPEQFKLCRHSSHGPDGYVEKISRHCPKDSDRFTVLSAKLFDDTQHLGELTCATRDQEPERNEAEILQKTERLQSTLNLLSTAKHPFDSLVLSGSSIIPTQLQWQRLRVRLQILLEINRLSRAARVERPQAADLTPEIRSLVSDLASAIRGSRSISHLETVIDSFAVWRGERSLLSLRALFPDDVTAIARQRQPQFVGMDDLKYATLFPSGVSLSETELLGVAARIATLNSDPRGVYRLAEAAVLTGFAQVRQLHQEVLTLRDLQVRLYRDAMDYSALPERLAELYGQSPEHFRLLLAPYQENKLNLRREVISLIGQRVQSLKSSAEAKKATIWNILDLAKRHSNDSRLPLLDGYRALAELDAAGLGKAFHDVNVVLKAQSVREMENSVQTLARAAADTLKTIRSLQILLDETVKQRTGFEQSIVGRIGELAKNSNGLERLAWLSDQVFERFGGGTIAEIGLQDSLRRLLNDIYSEFAFSLEKIPELRGS